MPRDMNRCDPRGFEGWLSLRDHEFPRSSCGPEALVTRTRFGLPRGPRQTCPQNRADGQIGRRAAAREALEPELRQRPCPNKSAGY